MKRLLLITYYFPPAAGGGVARTLSFARHLPEHGWQVSVLCADPESAPLRDDSRLATLPPQVEVHRVPTPALITRGRKAVVGGGDTRPSGLYDLARKLSNWLWLPDSFAAWRGPAGQAALDLVKREKFDVVLTSSPPDTVHTVGLDLRSEINIPWVVDFRDPWVGLSYKKPPTRWHEKKQRQLRDSVLQGADMILTTTRGLAESLGDRRAPGCHAAVHHLPNGWEDDVPVASERTVSPSGPLRVVYTGTLWDVPASKTCLRALAVSLMHARSEKPEIELHLVGPHESGEVDLVRELGLQEKVQFHGQVSYQSARAQQANADILLLLQVHGPGYEVAIPGKLYEYIASGRPILAFLEPGEAADLVQKAGGWVIGPEDLGAARQVFDRLLAGERPASQSDSRTALADSFRRDRVVAGLAKLLDSLIVDPPSGEASLQ